MTTTSEILERLREAGSAANVAGMARYGIRPAKAYGVATPVIRSIAKELGRSTELASALWSTNVLEARILAAMIADPLQIPEEEVERWVRDFDCWSVAIPPASGCFGGPRLPGAKCARGPAASPNTSAAPRLRCSRAWPSTTSRLATNSSARLSGSSRRPPRTNAVL